MHGYSRRDILRMGTWLATSAGLTGSQGAVLAQGIEGLLSRQVKVLWLQGMSCSGCSVSFLNTDEPGPLEALTELISLVFHSNVSAAQGDQVVELLDEAAATGDYLLVVEGAVPTAIPEACVIGGRPFAKLLPPLIRGASDVIAAGTCASFGGIPAAEGNPTGAVGLGEFMQAEGLKVEGRLINCPGCPTHPLSMLGTVAYVVAKGYPPVDPELLTPKMFYGRTVHDECPRFHYWEKREFADRFGEDGCLFKLGCLGPLGYTHCPRRQWNSGVNWCIRAGAPCTACTSREFARQKDFPFYRKGESLVAVACQDANRMGVEQ